MSCLSPDYLICRHAPSSQSRGTEEIGICQKRAARAGAARACPGLAMPILVMLMEHYSRLESHATMRKNRNMETL
jgi:hypothetical protein